MRFTGQTELAAFLHDHPEDAERLQAWVAEIRYRNWKSPEALSADFRNVDTSRSPLMVFRFGRPPIHIETLIDFRTSVVLLITIRQVGVQFAMQFGSLTGDAVVSAL